ncbi:UDP-glucuronosyltransferase 1-1 [Parelaphostrongylus tenuis]|uniref:glucuronosyltransferase n=1 Tax=Parelaphostrongylus tenuis TaxID=148309 RepID=A0AAD5QUP4_PARTN|nr:UDP-glucuronosyltransferase 1-1 [Parelaphostrongylus tenuis]
MVVDRETELFRNLVDPNFPDIVDIAKECPLVMVNSNELYEAPRPKLSKIVNIGGVGMESNASGPLSADFQRIINSSVGLVVFSFGSVAPSLKMPLTWKKAFLNAFSYFPEHHFVMKYEGTDLQNQLPPNVHVFKWFPQTALLAHPKTVAFISHGGYNSLQMILAKDNAITLRMRIMGISRQYYCTAMIRKILLKLQRTMLSAKHRKKEAIIAGVPLVILALFGDQPKNAKLAEKHRIAVNLQKNNLTADAIADALQEASK